MAVRRYLNFVTGTGNDLAQFSRFGVTGFLLHDCGFLAWRAGWNHPGVDSPFWRLYHNPTPGWYITIEGRRIELEPRTVVLIPEETVFDCHGPQASAHFWIHFSLEPHRAQALRLPVEVPVDAGLEALLSDARELAATAPGTLRDQQLYHAASTLLHSAFRRLPIVLVKPEDERVRELCQYIRDHPAEDHGNRALAGRVGMSVKRFTRWFAQETGATPAQYVRKLRVNLARQALSLGNESIEQLAESLGFPNRHYFTRVFTGLVGCSPAEFRKRHRQPARASSR
jgi:AraC-like DNA-binding protein